MTFLLALAPYPFQGDCSSWVHHGPSQAENGRMPSKKVRLPTAFCGGLCPDAMPLPGGASAVDDAVDDVDDVVDVDAVAAPSRQLVFSSTLFVAHC